MKNVIYKRFIPCLIYLLSILSIQAQQKIAYNWYFGRNSAITWNLLGSNGYPSLLSDSEMNTVEGVSTVSDSAGNLLFYTDGLRVYNSQHSVMQNGYWLYGTTTTTQSVISIPKPGNETIYYLFTADYQFHLYGANYSILDMTLDGGLGGIDSLYKNINLIPQCAEKLIGIQHSNGTDYWVLYHEAWTNNFFAYLITEFGLDTIPVISSIGSVHDSTSYYAGMGGMKASQQGDRIASVRYDASKLEIFHFDASTGLLSNCISITDTVINKWYSAEFSPNGRYLYTTGQRWFSGYGNSHYIDQWDLNNNDSLSLLNSRQILGYDSQLGSLQLAVDNMIYVNRAPNYLSCIRQPDLAYPACDLEVNAIYCCVNLGDPNLSGLGLPNYIAGQFLKANFTYLETCRDSITYFYIENSQSTALIQWNFNYPSTDPIWNIISTSDTIEFMYPSPGTYQVMLVEDWATHRDTCIQIITVLTSPVVDLGSDTSICLGDTLNFDLSFNDTLSSTNNCDYFWIAQIDGNSFYDSLSTYTITNAGIYIAQVTGDEDCGMVTDTLNVSYKDVEVDLGPDQGIVEGNNVSLEPGMTYLSYLWSTGDTTFNILVSDSGLYYLNVVDFDNCTGSDSIQIFYIYGSQIFDKQKLKIYPNPASTVIVIDQLEANSSIEIYNLRSELLLKKENCQSEICLNIQDLPSGTYFIKISSKSGTRSGLIELIE
ncbi:MAG: T9SS type A sorting domain-containing protein [Bacteroidales bacterium]|nr:T9SS type A sorting domain-containing protein [Bacteroidales bacterium]